MAYATNMAAMNAARKQFGKTWKESALIEKLDGEWHVQLKQPERGANWPFPVPSVEALAVEAADYELLEKQADSIANAQASEETDLKGKVWVKVSSAVKPTKLVWHIADEMRAANPSATRKEIQDECVRRGIASGTARTQYQAWKKCQDESAANALKAAELSKKFNSK